MPTTLEITGWIHPGPGTWILRFPWTTNPIPMNGSRGAHWARGAAKTRQVRNDAFYMARYARIPALGRCQAQLTQWINTRRTRDLDNFGLLEKPLYDGLTRAGIVTDDAPELMVKPRPTIVHVNQSQGLLTRPCFTLRIERLDDEVEP